MFSIKFPFLFPEPNKNQSVPELLLTAVLILKKNKIKHCCNCLSFCEAIFYSFNPYKSVVHCAPFGSGPVSPQVVIENLNVLIYLIKIRHSIQHGFTNSALSSNCNCFYSILLGKNLKFQSGRILFFVAENNKLSLK